MHGETLKLMMTHFDVFHIRRILSALSLKSITFVINKTFNMKLS